MHQTAGPYLRAEEILQPQLEPDREQQELDAQLGDLVEPLPAFQSVGAKREARHQESHERRQTEGARSEAEGEGDCEEQRGHCGGRGATTRYSTVTDLARLRG